MVEAETIEVDYKVEFGIIGEIGVANAKLIQDKDDYEIDIKLIATGIAKVLSRGREEQHISKGHIENGIMVTDLYQIIKSYGSKVSNKVYTINHKTKEVVKVSKKWKNGQLYKDKTTILEDAYAKDDLLTLYFNLNKYVDDKTNSRDYRFHAVGAEIQDGYVDVHIPNSKELIEFKKMLDNNCLNYSGHTSTQKVLTSAKKMKRKVIAYHFKLTK